MQGRYATPARHSGRTVPERLRAGRHSLDTASAALWLLAGLTLAAELVAGQALFHLFGETIYNPFSLRRPADLLLFAATLLTVHLGLLRLALAAARRVFGRRWGSALLGFNLLFAGLLAFGILFAVRATARLFGPDLPDLGTLRDLAGGRLLQGVGLLHGELARLALSLLLALAAYLVLRRVLLFERGGVPPRRLNRGAGAAWAIAATALLYASARTPDVRDALVRFSAARLALRALDVATDFDRDGFGLFAVSRDEAPFDGRRHPFALDLPDDGMDQDGLAGDFHAGPPGLVLPSPAFPGHRRHVVLIVLESTRGDALGKRWLGREIAPNLNALARAGSFSPEAYSNQSLTSQSLKVIFGGEVPPLTAGASLFADFRKAGYRIGIFSCQGEDWGNTANAVGMRANSDIFLDTTRLPHRSVLGLPNAAGAEVLRAFDRRLGRPADWTRPTFLYFNFQAAHYPYDGPGVRQILPGTPIAERDFSQSNRVPVARAYWNAVANADEMVGAVVARLKRLGVWQDTVLVVTADHGEELFEDGHIGHGLMLSRWTTRVPLVLSVPGIALPRPVGHSDLRTIILRAAGAHTPPPRGGPVFQFLDRLDRPSVIGMAEAGGAMTSLSLREGHVLSSDPAAAGRYRSVPAGSPLRTKVDRLARLWAQTRWDHVLEARARH